MTDLSHQSTAALKIELSREHRVHLQLKSAAQIQKADACRLRIEAIKGELAKRQVMA